MAIKMVWCLWLSVQVIGHLPFKDFNHRKLLMMLFAGPVFPEHRESSQEFQDLVTAILTPEDQRIGIPAVRRSKWYIMNES